MSYCLNLECPSPQNPKNARRCNACGFSLLLDNRYRTIKRLGQGGFGRTYVAVDEAYSDKPLCVIKQLIQYGDGHRTDVDIERFRQEVDSLEELGEHPQIPELLDYLEEEGGNYLIQEFIDGRDFEAALEEGGEFEEEGIRQLLDDLLPVLIFIHQRRVIHRDIKPQNLIAPLGDSPVFLVDFGASKYATGTALARTGTVIGSSGYIAPEQAMGRAVFSSDLYSLGVTCVHLLTGMHPFELYSSSQDDWVWQHYLLEPISDELTYVLNKMLRRSVNQRYRTAEAVLSDLRSPPPIVGQTRIQRFSDAMPRDIAAFAGYGLDGGNELDNLASSIPESDSKTGKYWYCAHQLTGHDGAVTTVSISPSGQVLASGSTDRRIMLWNIESGTRLHTFEGRSLLYHSGHSDRINTLHFTPDGSTLVSGSDDGTIKLWNLSDRTLMSTLSSSDWVISAIAISADGSLLVSGGENGVIEFWDLERGEFIERVSKHESRVSGLCISPNGKFLLSSSHDKTIYLWDLRTAHVIKSFYGHRDRIGAISTSFEWQLMLSGGHDGELMIWDMNNAKPVYTFQAHKHSINAIASMTTSSVFASGGDDTCIHLWSLEDKTNFCQTLATPTGAELPIHAGMHISQDNQRIGVGQIQVHKLDTLPHEWSIKGLAFSTNEKTLIGANADETIRIWKQHTAMGLDESL